MGETQSKSASPSGWSASYDVEGPSSSRLIEACQRGQTDLVSKLLRRGKKISKVDERGDTALHKAAAYGFTEIVTLLLKKNSELANVENVEGLTPFHLAAQYGKIECARIILDAAPKLVNAPFTKNPSNFDYSFIERSGKIIWNINNFSRIEEKKIFSEVFQLGGYKWRLVLYPRGSKGDDNLSLYLEVANHEKLAEGWSYLVGFTFGIVNQLTGVAKIIREVPAHRFYRSHTDLGFPQMVKKSTLYNRKFGIVVRDRVQVALCLKTLDASSFGLEESCGVYSCRLNGFSKSKDSRMISNTFYVAGVPWNLAVYPKGKQVSQTLSVYLKVVPPSIQPHYSSSHSQNTAQIQKESSEIDETPNEGPTAPIAIPSSPTSSPSITFAQASSSNVVPSSSSINNLSQSSSPTLPDPNAWFYVVNFRISLVNQLDGTKFTRSVDAKVFKHKCEDWGFPQFIKLSTLLNPESGFVNDDAILLEVSLEVVDCLRPANATSSKHLICTLPSTPSYGRPMSPLGGQMSPPTFPSSMAPLSSTLVGLSSQGVSSFSTLLRKPFSSKGYRQGVDWHINTPIKSLAFTPLHWAIYCGNLEAVTELLAKQADIEACDANGRTPLDWACYLGHYDTVKLLVAHHASAKVRDSEHAKPIHKATFIGSPDVIQAMLHHLDNLETDLVPLDRRRKASIGSEADTTSRAIETGLSPVPEGTILDHLASGMPPSPRDPALSPSTNSGTARDPTTQLLRDTSPHHRSLSSSSQSKGTSTEIISDSDLDGLTTSQQEASEDDGVVSSLKTETGGVLASSGKHIEKSALSNSSHRRHSSSDSGASGGNGSASSSTPAPSLSLPLAVHTPLQLCLRSQKSALAEQLVEDFDGNVNCVDMWGRTPLHIAAYLGDINLLELFLSRCHPQLVNYSDKDGYTPLHKAIAKGYFDCVQVLLNAGADIGLRSKSGYTPFHYAVLMNELQCAKMILEFDRRRGTAPVPLRDLEAARRGSDVVESDIPLPTEKKKATVSISDTIQLVRPDVPPAVNERTAAGSLHRSAERLPLGILHHPPGSEAAIARQLQQMKRMKGTSSDEEPFETKDSVPNDDSGNGTEVVRSSAVKSSRRRSVNFHGDNAVVRIKHLTGNDDESELGHDTTFGSSSQRNSTATPPYSRKSSEEAEEGAESDGDDYEGEDSSNSQPTKFVDDSALSADSDEEGDQDDRHSLGERQQTPGALRPRKRSNTTGNVGRHFGGRRLLSDDEEDPFAQSQRRMAVYEVDGPGDFNVDDLEVSGDDSPEESSESLSSAAAWRPSPGSIVTPSLDRAIRETRGRLPIRRGSSTPNANLDELERSEWAFRDVDGLASLSFGDRDSSQHHPVAESARNNRSTRRTDFSKSRSRSTGTFRTEGLIGAKTSSPPILQQQHHPHQQHSSQASSTAGSGELPKRSSKLSGILRAFSGGFKGTESSSVSSSASSSVVVQAAPTSGASSSFSNAAPSQPIPLPHVPSQHSHSLDSEGAQLRRGKVRRSSSSSSLESSHAIAPHRHHLNLQRPPVSPPGSPPTSPTSTHHPPRSTKLSSGTGSWTQNSSTTTNIGSSSTIAPNPSSNVKEDAKRSRKSRSPPPAGRRPKSGSISTAERDHALSSVISPRTNSPRHILSHSSGANVVNFGSDLRNTSSVSPPPNEDSSEDGMSAATAAITTSNTALNTSSNTSTARLHSKSPSDSAVVEGKSIELHRSTSGPSSDKLPHVEKTPVYNTSTSTGTTSDKPGSAERIPKEDFSTHGSPGSSSHIIASGNASASFHTSSVVSTTGATKKRSKSNRTPKSDLKIQINNSSLSSPASPGNVSGSWKELSSSSPRSHTVLPPAYAPQEILRMADVNGWLPLHTSVKQGNLQMTQYLLSKGASVLELANSMSVLDLAIQNQDATLTKILLQSGSPLSEVGPSLQTFLSQKIFPTKPADIAPPIPPSTFVGDMRALLNNAQFFDVTFTIEGKQVYGWKGLLATRCEVFRAMFTGTLREASESHVTITDVSYSTFYHIIEFIYTDSVSAEKMTLEDALQLLAAANRYILDRLKRIIERWLLSQLSEQNVGEILHSADLYQAPYLRSACLLYIANHLHRIPNLHDLLNGSFRGVLLDFLNSPQ